MLRTMFEIKGINNTFNFISDNFVNKKGAMITD